MHTTRTLANVSSHYSFSIEVFLKKTSTTLIRQVWLPATLVFPKIKLQLKGRRVNSIKEIQEKSQLCRLNIVFNLFTENDFMNIFQN